MDVEKKPNETLGTRGEAVCWHSTLSARHAVSLGQRYHPLSNVSGSEYALPPTTRVAMTRYARMADVSRRGRRLMAGPPGRAESGTTDADDHLIMTEWAVL